MKKLTICAGLLILFSLALSWAAPAFSADKIEPYVEAVEQAKEGMTLWELIKTGGFIMVILAIMSIGAVALVVYNFMTMKPGNLLPREFGEDVLRRLKEGDERSVRSLCSTEDNIIANVVTAGLDKKQKGTGFAREAIENCARKEVNDLWQIISYLADIAAIAPLIGLLGTVLGMIQAFNVIAFQTAVVKPIVLAGGVSKAMVTTAGGLIVAIPAMLFYAYFRGKVQEVANILESYSTDVIKIMEKM